MKYLLISFLVISLLAASLSPKAEAYVVPTYPSCVAPQGTLKVKYDNGVHGVPGKQNEYRGSDSVYKLSDETLMQCLCPEDGRGIQTNWWKISSLSDTDIKILEREGWIYIPNGEAWGLDNAPYLAKNVEYSCRGQGGITQSATSSILGLASTGNTLFLNSTVIAGLISLLVGFIIKLKKSLS